MTKPKDGVDLDSILAELGQFGRYQIHNYCFIMVPILLSAVYNSQYIFAAGDLNYRCKVPECESSPPQFGTNGWGIWALPESGGRCERFTPIGDQCAASSFHVNETKRCSSWVYETDNTIVAEFDLACQEWKRTLVGTIHSAGLFVALPLTSLTSDIFGRRTALVLTAVAPGIIGLIRSFSNSYYMYLAFEFLDATLGSGVYSTGFILALEMVGLNRRVLGGNIISSTFAIGQVVLALAAWAFPYWRTFTRVIYTPSLLFIFYFFIIEESVRWLLSKGNKKEAARIIFKAAEINKRKLSPESIKKLTEDNHEEETKSTRAEIRVHSIEPEKSKKPSLFMEVITSKTLMSRLLICSFWWITVTFIYYGLSINSVSLAGNSYVNYILTSLVEIPGYAVSVFTLDRFGRKSAIMTAFFICGVSLVALPFVPGTLQWLITTLSLLGKLCISMAFSSIYIYTSELFPTQVRHSLLGTCSMFGRIGNLLAPQTPLLLLLILLAKLAISMVFTSVYIYTIELFPTNARNSLMGACSMIGRVGHLLAPQTPLLMAYMESLPYLVFGMMAACSCGLMLLTPETLHMKLPDTVRQAEDIAVAPRVQRTTDVIA